ncbi:MAG TPA: energy transducer TonB [Myxococcales bacterium]|jgi:TonB family protein|nr:energy transducer TonB [Myxococcales bacterium]
MPRALLFLAIAACAAPQQQEISVPTPVRLVEPGECTKDAGAACYQKGRSLLESRKPEWAQASMEYIDRACAAGTDQACDLADLAFKGPVRISGRAVRTTSEVRQQHRSGTVAVRCVLNTEGTLRDCVVLQSVPGMDPEVLDAIGTRRYQPATWGGNPVEVPFDVQIEVK